VLALCLTLDFLDSPDLVLGLPALGADGKASRHCRDRQVKAMRKSRSFWMPNRMLVVSVGWIWVTRLLTILCGRGQKQPRKGLAPMLCEVSHLLPYCT
jgi:hypothetical protein